MTKSRTLSVIGFLILAALPSAASAASGRVGQVGQVPVVGGGVGASLMTTNDYMTPGVGNVIANTPIVAAPSVQNPAGLGSSIGNGANINAQSNVAITTTINGSSNIDVSQTINGSDVAYGMNGANALNLIDNASDFASGVGGNSAAVASSLADTVLSATLGQ
jgi:hypothetical protein